MCYYYNLCDKILKNPSQIAQKWPTMLGNLCANLGLRTELRPK